MDEIDKPFRLTLRAVVRDAQGRILLLQRSKFSRNLPSTWEFPGGKMESGETLSQGLEREILEETGLKVKLTKVLGFAQRAREDDRIAYLLFDTQVQCGTLKISQEHDAYQWVSPKDLPNVDLSFHLVEFAKSLMGQ